MVESNKNDTNSELVSNTMKRNGFHAKYLSYCKSKNLMPLLEVKVKQRNTQLLDFHCDRLKLPDLLAILDSLHSDESLKILAIRLRKNKDPVLEDVDTLKKTKSLMSHPVVMTNYIFSELMSTLHHFLQHNKIIQSLIFEGLPLCGKYLSTISNGLTTCHTLKTLSFARSFIGDDGCEIICATVKHLPNIESLDFSDCNLSVKGAESVTNLIKFHKIRRFSEGWERSLRYGVVDAENISGLRKMKLNSNPRIGDEGVTLLVEVLKEDVWIKDIEMQNCGISDAGAQSIIKCLNVNKSLLTFNINENVAISEHLYRHIYIHLGNMEQDNSDSTSDSKASRDNKMTTHQIQEKIKFLEEQLESEVFRRKQMEQLNEQMHKQFLECQKEMSFQTSFRIPEGYTLVTNETLEKLLKESKDVRRTDSESKLNKSRRKRRNIIKKVKSCTQARAKGINEQHQQYKTSKSECLLKPILENHQSQKNQIKMKPYIERNVGDYIDPRQQQGQRNLIEANINVKDETLICSASLSGADVLKMFVKKKTIGNSSNPIVHTIGDSKDLNPRSIFMRSNCITVPNNSDAESTSSSR